VHAGGQRQFRRLAARKQAGVQGRDRPWGAQRGDRRGHGEGPPGIGAPAADVPQPPRLPAVVIIGSNPNQGGDALAGGLPQFGQRRGQCGRHHRADAGGTLEPRHPGGQGGRRR